MTGPIPKASRLKVIAGNAGRKRLKNEPVAVRGLPACPTQLQGTARVCWEFLTTQLRAMRLDYAVDALALEGACVAYGRAVDADAVLARDGMTFKSPNGYIVPRPEVAISAKSWLAFRSFASEFGLTAAARTRINMEMPKAEGNPFAALTRD